DGIRDDLVTGVQTCALPISNLMDGLDGLCGGVTAVISAGFLFLAVHLAVVSGGFDPNLDALRVVIAIALLGAVLGFIPFNFNPEIGRASCRGTVWMRALPAW